MGRAGRTIEESVRRFAPGGIHGNHRLVICLCGGSLAKGGCVTNQHLFFGNMERKQIQQIVVGGCRFHRKDPRIGLAARNIADRTQAGDISEQLFDRIGLLRTVQRADLDFQLPRLPWHSRRRSLGCRSRGGRDRRGRRRRRRGSHRRGVAGDRTRSQITDATHQGGGGNRLTLPTRLMPCQQAARSIRRFQQNIHHLRDGLQFMAAQAIEQRLHLMGQFGHIRKPKSG